MAEHDLDINKMLRCMSLLIVSLAINEFTSNYFPSRYVLLGWAVLCIWILLDAALVAASLTQAELLLKEQVRRNDALQAENLKLATHMVNTSDNHLLLCEIRTRLSHQGHRHKGLGSQSALLPIRSTSTLDTVMECRRCKSCE